MTRLSRSVLLSLGVAGVCSGSPSPGSALSSSPRNIETRSNGRFLSFPVQQTTRDKPRVSRRQVEDTSAPLFNVSYVGYLIERKFGYPCPIHSSNNNQRQTCSGLEPTRLLCYWDHPKPPASLLFFFRPNMLLLQQSVSGPRDNQSRSPSTRAVTSCG